MNSLPYSFSQKVLSLGVVGLSFTGQIFLENFMLAEVNGIGVDNRSVLMERIRVAPDAAKVAAMAVFDEFVNVEK